MWACAEGGPWEDAGDGVPGPCRSSPQSAFWAVVLNTGSHQVSPLAADSPCHATQKCIRTTAFYQCDSYLLLMILDVLIGHWGFITLIAFNHLILLSLRDWTFLDVSRRPWLAVTGGLRAVLLFPHNVQGQVRDIRSRQPEREECHPYYRRNE